MSVSINAQALVTSTWTIFKTYVLNKGLLIQYDSDGSTYSLFAFDGNIGYSCTIWQITMPYGVIAGGYSQAQNDTDKSDFETNYKPYANQRVAKTDNFGNPVYVPFQHAAAFGLFPGVNSGTVNGYSGLAVLTASPVRATTYTQSVSPGQRSLKSSSSSDTNSGTGAWNVKITYYDGYMNGPKTETVTLNGTTAASTINTDIQFIENMEVVNVGSNTSNVGVISLYTNNNGTGTVIGTIATGDNQTFWAHHYIASGKTCYLLGLRVGSTATSGTSFIQRFGNPIINNLAQLNVSGFIRHGSSNQIITDYEWDVPLIITGPDFIVGYDKPDGITLTNTHLSFDYLEF